MADNIGTVVAIYEAFGRADAGWIVDQLRDDVAWDVGARDTGLPYLMPGRGKAHVLAFLTAVAANLEFSLFQPGVPCEGEDTVIVPVRIAARNLRSGRSIAEDTEAHVWTFDADGKVASFSHITDWAPHEAAAGAATAVHTGRTLRVLSDDVHVHQAGSPFEVFTVSGAAESGPPPHAHPWQEAYYGLDGEVEVSVDGQPRIVRCGDFVSIPAGALHAYRIASEQARFLVMTSGARASAFFADLDANVSAGPPTADSFDAVVTVARRNGLSSPLFS